MLDLLEQALEQDKKLLIAAPNWAEIRYMIERKAGSGRWNEVKTKLLGLPLEIRNADSEAAEAAGEIKALHRMSLADSFTVALARREQAALYTGDPEFKAVEGEQRVVWL